MSKEERHDEEGHTPPQRVENKTKTQQGGGMPLSAMSKEEWHNEEGYMTLLVASKQQKRNEEGHNPPCCVRRWEK